MNFLQPLIDWILGFVRDWWNSLVAQVPVFEMPPWLGSLIDGIGSLLVFVGQLSAWVPVEVLGWSVSAVLAAWAVALVIRIVRIVASFATAGGGS